MQKLQIAFMTVTIVPIRVLLVFFFYFLTWFINLFATAGMKVPFQEPASPFRLKLFSIVRQLYRSLLLVLIRAC